MIPPYYQVQGRKTATGKELPVILHEGTDRAAATAAHKASEGRAEFKLVEFVEITAAIRQATAKPKPADPAPAPAPQ